MKTNKLFLAGLLVAGLIFTNCEKNDAPTTAANTPETAFNFGNSTSRDFNGKIVSEENIGIAGVTVKIGDKTTTTNATGEYTISAANVKENFAYITATKDGFFNGSRTTFPHEGMNSSLIKLRAFTLTQTIPTGVSNIVALADATNVSFDGSFKNVDGTTYTGNVKVYMSHLDPHDASVFEKMPGNLFAQNAEGNMRGLQTYGMINVELRGENNQKLQIADGHKAKINVPITLTQRSSSPASIALWHFDEVKGFWSEEGAATRVGNSYIGDVSHFSEWNCDDAWPISRLTVIATNEFNLPLAGVKITLTRVAGSTGDILINLGTTNATGTLTAGTPYREVLTFRAYTSSGSLISEQLLPATTLSSRTVYVKLVAPNKVNPIGTPKN